MATPQYSTPSTSNLPTPYSSPLHSVQSADERSWLSVSSYLQPRELGAHEKARTAQEKRSNEIKIVDDVDDLIPQFLAMGEGASVNTPPSGNFDSASLPFILADGLHYFQTPTDTAQSSPSVYSPSLPTSATSSLFNLDTSNKTSVLQAFSLWRCGSDSPAHIYTQMLDQRATHETIFLGKPDISSMRYDPVRAAISHLSCQVMHLNIPLMAPSSPSDKESSNNSVITISLPRRNPVILLTTLYSHGTLVASYEVQMEERSCVGSEDTLYSASLPQELIDGLCAELDHTDKDVASDAFSGIYYLDAVALMRFVQKVPEGNGETELLIAAEFNAVEDSSLAAVEISYLELDDDSSQKSDLTDDTPMTSPPSDEQPVTSRFAHRSRLFGRPAPKLSVSIPPQSMNGIKGIQLCTDSPDSAARPTPQTGVPSNVMPVTPFEQLIHTPLSPPQILSSRASKRSSYAPTPSESAYPFTLSSASPGPAPSPAFGVLDTSASGHSAPAWLHLPRNASPFTPSFYLQRPHSAAASSAMSSLTQQALDAGTPTFLYNEYFGESLASPIPITSAARSHGIATKITT